MTTPHDDPARDAWLSEALRHAPDADAAPSAELSNAILRHARQAVNAPRAREPARRPNPLAQLWAWLARPPVAAGFATMMVATLVGVMWWDRPLDDALPRSNTPAATTAAEPPVAPPPVAAAPERPPAVPQAAEPERKEESAANTAAAPAPKRDRARERAFERRAPAAATDASRARSADTAAPLPATAPATTPAAPAAAPGPTGEIAAQSAAAATSARDESVPQGSSAPARALAKSAPAAAPAGALSLRAQDTDTPLLTIDEPRRWSWQRDVAMRAMTPALQRWLVQLDRAARWRPTDSPPPAASSSHAVLQLWRDGVPRATITLGDDAVWLTLADGAPMTAPLAPATAASLKAALIAATP